MSRIVYCQKLKREAPGLAFLPHTGALGQRIYDSISQEGWQQWLAHLAIVLNDYRLNSADPESIVVIEQHMVGFLFGEGEFGNPAAMRPPARKK